MTGSVGTVVLVPAVAIMVTATTAAVVTPVPILVVATTAATITRPTVVVAATAFTTMIPVFTTRAAILVATLLITTLATMPATVMAMTAMAPVLALLTTLVLVRRLGMCRQRKGGAKCQCKKNGTLHNLLSFNSTLNTLCRMSTNVRANDVINGIRTTRTGNNGHFVT